MPWTEAAVLETQRLSSVLPIAPPRVAERDLHIGGYTLRKGAQVQINLYSLHRDPAHWGQNAEEFRPERFLRDDGHGGVHTVADEWLQPFGYGKRKCLGEGVARLTVFLFLANLLRVADLRPDDSDRPLSADPEGGLTIGPKKFALRVIPRAR